MRLLRKVVKYSEVNTESKEVYLSNVIKSSAGNGNEYSFNNNEVGKNPIEDEVQREVEIYKQQLVAEQLSMKMRLLELEKKTLEDVRLEAQNIKNNAIKEAEKLLKQESEKGYKQGYEKGQKDADEKCKDILNAAAKFLSGINEKQKAYFMQNEEKLLTLSVSMAEKIVSREITADSKVLYSIAEEAAAAFRNSSRLKISFSGKDFSKEVIADADFINEIKKSIPEVTIEIIEDAEKGTVILDNDREITDASVPTQLEMLREIVSKKQA